MPPDADHYHVLGIARGASPDEIRAAYRRAARASHPDLHPGDESAAHRFKRVRLAYDVLSDPARRAVYDASTRPERPPAAARQRAAVGADEPVSLARELGLTVRAIRGMAKRSAVGRRVRRLIHYLEGL